jgi:serine/threonine protein kinase
MWKRLRHQNIAPFIGVTQDNLQFVSEWMPNGTLTQYLAKNPGVNRVDLVSFPLMVTTLLVPFSSKLLDVAEGLAYLHSKHATHGDLKGVGTHSQPPLASILTSFR